MIQNTDKGNEVVEGNKIIADFMEWTIEPGMENEENPYYNAPYKEGGYIPAMFLLNKLRFHSSWDWLMPVVEKIEHCDDDKNDRGYSFHVCVFDKDCHIFEYLNDDEQPPLITSEGKTKIKATWLAVVEFIKWYNTQK